MHTFFYLVNKYYITFLFYINSLCTDAIVYVIGLTDNMRENFHLMRALATHTRVSPAARVEKLMRFNDRLRQETKVIDELKDWNMKLDRSLVEVPARILSSEKLVFGNNSKISCYEGDWTRPMQKARLFQSNHLRNWVLIGNQRDTHSIRVNNL